MEEVHEVPSVGGRLAPVGMQVPGEAPVELVVVVPVGDVVGQEPEAMDA